MADSPAYWWRLGELTGTTAVDQIAALNGTYNDATLAQPGLIAGDSTKSTLFAGSSSSYVGLPSGVLVSSSSSFMTECWFKATTNPGSSDYRGLLQFEGSSDPFRIIMTGDPSYYPICFGFNGGPKAGFAFTFDNDIHQLVIGYDWSGSYTGFVAYLDGASKTLSNISNPFGSDNNSYLGRYGGGTGFNGDQQECLLFNAILSGTRVAAHYSAGT